jgi:hypothetical protein
MQVVRNRLAWWLPLFLYAGDPGTHGSVDRIRDPTAPLLSALLALGITALGLYAQRLPGCPLLAGMYQYGL